MTAALAVRRGRRSVRSGGSSIQRIRKSWHVLRRNWGLSAPVPKRLVVEKARWLNDALSPVVLMIDDLTNAWHSSTGQVEWDDGGDWGGGLNRDRSGVAFLEERLMRDYPEARVTFFVVAGPISAYTHHQPFSYAAPLDAGDDSRRFFRQLSADPRFELAYHGFNHGTPGKRTQDFVQEWRGFPSLQAAVEQTRDGFAIFERATGRVPVGGKYGGYDYNLFAEPSLDDCGFLWWCRDWMPRDVSGGVPAGYYEPQFFGRNLIVALPSTVHGHLWARQQIDTLLHHRQMISVAEHIAPVRPDGLVQTPNIVDDMDELRRLFAYLRGKNVWHATGSQVASYVVARERTLVHDVTGESFSLRYDGRFERPALTLRIEASAICTKAQPFIEIDLPDGTTVVPMRLSGKRHTHLATVPVISGQYHVKPRAAGPSTDG